MPLISNLPSRQARRQRIRRSSGACGCSKEQALDIARDEQPDLILVDIRLPDISGLEVTRLLKQDDQTKTIPIIALTALASPEYEKKGLESGCDGYIAKPIILDNFLRRIESSLKSVQ
jgi:two-component system cell cycle response regulator DivK